MNITISDQVLKDLLKMQAIEEWRVWNYTRVDTRIDNYRYDIADKIMTIVMKEIKEAQGRKRITY